MANKTHPIFRWPGSLLWLFPLAISAFTLMQLDLVGSMWWYLLIPTCTAFAFIDLFTKVWFGITVLITLFFYCSIGSSGIPVSYAIWEPATWVSLREMRGLELTEFEWFHWWPFKWLIALLCLNMSIVTIRKIPFNVLTIGVWSIHTGVILLVLGCLVYFSKKIEGDVVISRHQVSIQIPGEEEASMLVAPGNSIVIGPYTCEVSSINPSWELLTGDDKGKRTYAVSISMTSEDASFTRQLIGDYPEYTEDVIRTDNPKQPMARAIKVLGTALVDDSIKMSLERDVKSDFYVTQSSAIYLRELDENGVAKTRWIEHPIPNLPRFNDYVSDDSEVWDAERIIKHPIALEVPSEIAMSLTVTDYLRYAFMDARIVPGGNDLNPVLWATIERGDIKQPVKMFAFDPSNNTTDNSLMVFKWLDSPNELASLQDSLLPTLEASLGEQTYELPLTNSEEFSQIGDSAYEYRLTSIQNNLNIEGITVSLVIVELKNGEDQWVRWVFEDSSLNRDITESADHLESNLVDDAIKLSYDPGAAPITLVAGEDVDGIQMLLQTGSEKPTQQAVSFDEPLSIIDDVQLVVHRLEANTQIETRPTVVPKQQRDPNVSNTMSMIRVIIKDGDQERIAWLPYHHYPFESSTQTVNRFRYQPTIVGLANGKIIELMFSREKAPLPTPVALNDFEIDTHIGGFSGRTSSILNWRSLISFPEVSDELVAVSVNDPNPHHGYWFFQSQWDPPSQTSQGLNYTVLGVGNREAVFTMLLGTCITVLGMMWAFFVKPTIKRKRQQTVYGANQ